MELMGSATRLRQGYGVPSIEGKAATGSGERAGEASEFQIRGKLFLLFLAQFLESRFAAQRVPEWVEPKKGWCNRRWPVKAPKIWRL